MIDPMISLAFSMHSNKGVYALLLGSGISRSAGIPTGWEVVLDLIRKVAHLQNADCEPNPEVWYKSEFGEEPDYSKLLERLLKTAPERQQLLKSYFEPTEEEREEGKKLPTVAHKAIAELVASGHIRVIITTNFDRLMEDALRAIGIEPTIISTTDALKGAMPLIHTQCTIVKINGDYLDTRIKNTPTELKQYEEPLTQLLDQIFDEFGLIVCGWSAEYDVALRTAIERCPNRRFTTYWVARGSLGDSAKRLINLRQATEIVIRDADSFFQELAEKVTALQEFDKSHPLSVKAAVATLKKYLVEDKYEIKLHDLVHEETEKLYSELLSDQFSLRGSFSSEELNKRVKLYENLTEVLIALMITGCYWGKETHEAFWVKCIERIANSVNIQPGNYCKVWHDLALYPSLLLLYAGGVASIATRKYSTFVNILYNPVVRGIDGSYPAVMNLTPFQVMNDNFGRNLENVQMYRRQIGRIQFKDTYTPLSDRIFNLIREPLREVLPDDIQFKKCFDRFEYLFALCNYDNPDSRGIFRGFLGRFAWQNPAIAQEVTQEIRNVGSAYPLLRLGLFDGQLDKLLAVKKEYDGDAWGST